MIESKGHKITPIDGDLAVSRNAEIGGDADIHGKARVAGSLKVEGFLDAPHIKGAAKGLFNSVEELTREYPNPRPGWFAIVLDATNKEKGILYKAENRGWVATTGEAKPYEFIKDSINVFASKGELADETQRAQSAEHLLTQRIVNETVRATEAENEIKKDAVKFSRLGIIGYADKLELMAGTIDGDEVRYIDIPAATETKAGVVSAEDKKKFVKSITWNNDNDPSNMNDFVAAGVYDIKGEHTRTNDNLPILNTGGGHTFNARLTVLDSSISGNGKDDDKCITQVLSFSNRLGQGEVYIRTGKGSSLDNLTWEKWSTLQRNVNVGEVTTLNNLTDNGIYSGVYVKNAAEVETFVMVVINNYAAASQKDIPKSVSQFKYSVSLGGSFAKYETRVGGGNPVSFPYAWEILNKDEITSMISAEIKKVNDRISTLIDDNDPDTLDSIKDLINWVNEHGNTVEGLLAAINANADKIDQTISYAAEEFAKLSTADNTIKAAALRYDGLTTKTTPTNVTIKATSVDLENNLTFNIPAATTESAGVMSAEDKSKLKNLAEEGDSYDLDTYTNSGVYQISTGSNEVKNYPIQTSVNSVLRLTVIDSYDDNNHVITQVVNINNNAGGEGNVYIRTCQNEEWKAWGKLQTNVEVGLIDQAKMDDLTDNGIYSGILSTTGETFVIICINNYAIAQQVGVQHISHLKYSLVVGTGEVRIEKRTRDAYGFWTDWENIGGGSTLPEATFDTIGGVRLGSATNDKFAPLVNITEDGTGVGIRLDSIYFTISSHGLALRHDSTMKCNNDGFGVALGTTYLGAIIPCTMGTAEALDSSVWELPTVGIPYNKEQFCLKHNGLNLNDGIGSGVTKVTWDSSSNMNDFKTPGVYDIYGERTIQDDNLPILNASSGHSIAARLTVVASTLQPANNEICVTQFLQLSNRVGGEGATYVRTYNENNNGMNGWSAWQKQMGMVETLINGDDVTVGQDIFSISTAVQKIGDGLNGMIDNGMYSGIYIDNIKYTGVNSLYYLTAQPTFAETFVLIVINDYAASGTLNLPRHITQLKYAVDAMTGQSTVKKRVGTGNNIISWGDWEDIGGSGNNYLGVKSLLELRDDKTIKSGTYYGLLSNNGNPFILEVTTNFDTDNIDDKEKLGLKRVLVATSGNNCIEYISTGSYFNSAFRYASFDRKNDNVSYNIFENLNHCSYSTTMMITKFDDSITIPDTHSVLYNHILNTAKNISNISIVYIKTSPGCYNDSLGGSINSSTIIEVVYSIKKSYSSLPYKYEKLVLNIGTPSKVFVIQPLIELQELE